VQQGSIQPEDACFIDFSAMQGDDAAGMEMAGPGVDRQLMAFLQFIGKSPLVTYHVPYVGAFLQRAFKERLGVDFQPNWVDLAWLLPSMYGDKSQVVMPLDHWIEVLGLDGGVGRRNAMENTLLLARIFQMLIVRAVGKNIDTAAQLVDESSASTFLRRNH
jgi:DNA polymerase-3 subunit epsilon